MATSKQGTVLPWSYSSLNAFENCSRRYYLTHISKAVKQQQTAATLWGNDVHKALELAVSGQQALSVKFAAYAPLVERLRMVQGNRYTEQKFGLTASLAPTGFFGNDVWYRGVIDYKLVGVKNAVVVDYKTGKVSTDGDQLRLFAATTFAQHPHVAKVRTRYIWLAHDKVTGQDFERADAPAIWDSFKPRVERMVLAMQNNRWAPKPSGLCRWCPVGQAHCEFWQSQGD